MVLGPFFTIHPATWPAYFFSLYLALVVKPSPYRRLFFLPPLALTIYTLFSTTGDPNNDYLGTMPWLTLTFYASDFILLSEPQRELRRVPPEPADKTGIENAPLLSRMGWAANLWGNLRGVGWAHEPAAGIIPAHPSKNISRTRFILHRLLGVFGLFILHDLANIHVRWNPVFHASGPGWRADGWAWRAAAVATWATAAYTSLQMGIAICSIVAIGTRLSEPYYWPWFMGHPRDAYTLRRFWGRGWHQLMRRFVSTHGRRLVQFLGLRRGSNPSSYTQLFVAFFLSALVHYLPEVMAFRNWSTGGAFVFFMLQPCAITVEDFVIWLGRRAGLSSEKWCYVGYLTTFMWFVVVVPIWQEPIARAGVMEGDMPASLVMGLWKGHWVLPPFPEL